MARSLDATLYEHPVVAETGTGLAPRACERILEPGLGAAKTIVSINSDPDAAIFQSSRFGVAADSSKGVPCARPAWAITAPSS